jgi:cation:H+ antiporter
MSALSDPLLILIFTLAATLSLGTSWILVSRLERIGARIGVSEALLGMLAALAADAPELTAAVTAQTGHQSRIGAGVVIGSNVFNLAALLGLGALVAGRIALHRRVIALEGAVAIAIATVCVLVVVAGVPPAVGVAMSLVVLLPYLVLLGLRPDQLGRLRLPVRWRRWLAAAIHEEELELEPAIHPPRGRRQDLAVAGGAVAVVVAASVVMEQSASELGTRHAVPGIIVGALVLAGVTSLPNAVAAVYLAARGRGAATLSTAMNSNALNVVAGLLLPASFVGLGSASLSTNLVALAYLGMTALVLTMAYAARGLLRRQGALIIAAYGAFVGLLLAVA